MRLPDLSRLLVCCRQKSVSYVLFSRDPSQQAKTVLSFSYPTETCYQLSGEDPSGPRKLISFACIWLPLKWLITFWREEKLLSLELKTEKACKFVSILVVFSLLGATLFSICGENFSAVLCQFWNCRLNDKSNLI